MGRPTKEQVDAALAIADGAKKPGPTPVLAAEVRALQEELEVLRSGEAYQLSCSLLKASIDREVELRAGGEARKQVSPDYVSDLNAAAIAFVENREEATANIWYVSGKLGRKLLEVLGIPYVEKE